MESGFPSRSTPRQTALSTLRYSHRFRYPLTLEEIWIWQPFTTHSKKQFTSWPHQKQGFFYLPNSQQDILTRKRREIVSRKKFNTAQKALGFLKRVPTIKAIYITGSLAMNNCKKDDDIDIMIISAPDAVWITRAAVVLVLALFSSRRPYGLKEHSSVHVSDKICDNLYLSQSNLVIAHHPGLHPRNYYLAHEILQAKLVWGGAQIDREFIQSNSWVEKYFPVAFSSRLNGSDSSDIKIAKSRTNLAIFILNTIFFLVQYLYMRPGLTIEKVGMGYAFFHPRQNISFCPC